MTSTPVWPGPQSAQDPAGADPDGFDLLAGQDAADRPGAFLAGLVQVVAQVASVQPVAFQQVLLGARGETLAQRRLERAGAVIAAASVPRRRRPAARER